MEHTLHNIFPEEWDPEYPPRLTDLMNADYDTLDTKAKALRTLAVQLVHSFEREPVHTAGAARSMIENHRIPARKGKWVAVVLNADKEREYKRAEGGAMRLNHAVSTNLFEPTRLKSKAPLPENGRYLFIFGGSPKILSEDQTAEKIASLSKEVPVADILFWDTSEGAAMFYSVGAGVGQQGNVTLDFPDPVALEKARTV